MKHEVLKPFIDKESGVYFAPGFSFESENFERVKELEKLGFIKANEEISSLKKVEKKTTRKKVVDDNAGKD